MGIKTGASFTRAQETDPVTLVGTDGLPIPAGSAADPAYAAGYGFDIAASPTTTNGAYSAGEVMGGFLEFEVANLNDAPVLITGVQVTFKAAVQPNLRAIFLSAAPAAALADNAAYSLSAADALLVRRSLSSTVLGAAYTSHGTPKSISLVPQPFVMKPYVGGKKIGLYIVDDSGVTLTSTSDMQVRVSGLGA